MAGRQEEQKLSQTSITHTQLTALISLSLLQARSVGPANTRRRLRSRLLKNLHQALGEEYFCHSDPSY